MALLQRFKIIESTRSYAALPMISVQIADHRFQLRAAAIVAHAGQVLLHRLEGDAFWALPGGRVEPGEEARATVVREMQEELGEQVACAGLLYVVENFFTVRGQPHHEIGCYFRVHLTAGSPLFDTSRSHAGVEGARRLEFRWFPTGALQPLDVRPSFLREALARPLEGLQHIVQRG